MIITIVIRLKYFAVLIGSNPLLILHNQPALTKFGRCAQYKTDSMVYLIGHEAAWAIDHRSMPFPGVATEDEIAEFLTKT